MNGAMPLDDLCVSIYFPRMQHPTMVNCFEVDLSLIKDLNLFSHKKFKFSDVPLLQSVFHCKDPPPYPDDGREYRAYKGQSFQEDMIRVLLEGFL